MTVASVQKSYFFSWESFLSNFSWFCFVVWGLTKNNFCSTVCFFSWVIETAALIVSCQLCLAGSSHLFFDWAWRFHWSAVFYAIISQPFECILSFISRSYFFLAFEEAGMLEDAVSHQIFFLIPKNPKILSMSYTFFAWLQVITSINFIPETKRLHEFQASSFE